MDKYIGRLLDNRYEILEVIGTGGMAVVYKARCHRLNRLVAIKILKSDYLEDEDFRRRFHAESQAVAMLSHPNIVSVYDVSTSISMEADYIVMELIEGITLKQYMEKKGFLNWKETLHFAMQIAKALEHAHSRGIVHRDIKPHNVMVLKNGSVKVTDFGIARMMSKGNTLTKEALGSVHYISPEQAKGGRVDNRSDIYSLGVVMYEMMSGRPPYDGESPVAVAIQHINGGAPMPSTINPNIPGGLEQIIMKAMAQDPAQRYDSASQMLVDMDDFRKDPTILFDYNVPPTDAVTSMPRQTPVVLETNPPRTTAERVVNKADGGRRTAQSGSRTSGAVVRNGDRRPPRKPQQTPQKTQEAQNRRREEEESRNRVAIIAIIICAVVALLSIAIVLILWLGGGSSEPQLVEVPNLIGENYFELPEYPDFNIKRQNEIYDELEEAGTILNQDPDPGTEVEKGRTILVTVSLGQPPKEATMIDFTQNYDPLSAKAYLDGLDMGLQVEFREEFNDIVETGMIIRTEPALGTKLEEGQTVILYISKGTEIKSGLMPNVVNAREEVAKKTLENQKLDLDIKTEEIFDGEIEAGYVVRTEPSSGETLKTGQTVKLYISKGPETAVMPNLVNDREEDAKKSLEDQELDLDIKTEEIFDMEVEAGCVVRTEPSSGETVKTGQTVKLYISKGPETAVMPNLVGKDVDTAKELLEYAGFEMPELKYEYSDEAEDTVLSQSEEKNTQVPLNKEIVLTVSKGPEPTDPPAVMKDVQLDLKGYALEAACTVEVYCETVLVYSGTVEAGTTSITLPNQTGSGAVSYVIVINETESWEQWVDF